MDKFQDIRQVSETAYQFMLRFQPENYEDGRYDLDNGVYVNIMTYETKPRKDCVFEAHKNYIDIQYMIHGREIIAVEPVEEMHKYHAVLPYDAQNDIELYENNMDCVDYVIGDGEYLILPCPSAHMPGVCVGGVSKARKAVIKIPV